MERFLGNSFPTILGNPGATSRDDATDIFGRAIFSGESLLQELESPWELTLTESVPEVVKVRPAYSGQSTRSSSWVTLSPSYTKQFSSSIDLVAWSVQRGDCRGKFQEKIFNEAEEITRLNMVLGTNILFHQFSPRIYRRYKKFTTFTWKFRSHVRIITSY